MATVPATLPIQDDGAPGLSLLETGDGSWRVVPFLPLLQPSPHPSFAVMSDDANDQVVFIKLHELPGVRALLIELARAKRIP